MDDPAAATRAAAALVAEGNAQMLMKGSLHTDELMSVLTSRTDSEFSRLASVALGVLFARKPHAVAA